MSAQHPEGWARRRFLRGLTVAGTAGLLGLYPRPVAAEPPLETTRLRVHHSLSLCLAPSTPSTCLETSRRVSLCPTSTACSTSHDRIREAASLPPYHGRTLPTRCGQASPHAVRESPHAHRQRSDHQSQSHRALPSSTVTRG